MMSFSSPSDLPSRTPIILPFGHIRKVEQRLAAYGVSVLKVNDVDTLIVAEKGPGGRTSVVLRQPTYSF